MNMDRLLPEADAANDDNVLAAILHTFWEAISGAYKLVAYNALCRSHAPLDQVNFFSIAAEALHNDMLTHAQRALDEHAYAKAFWYVVRCKEAACRKAARRAPRSLHKLRVTSGKLRHLRTQTQFRLDHRALVHPAEMWISAGITDEEVFEALRAVAHVMSKVKVQLFGGDPLHAPPYDGSDVERMVAAYGDPGSIPARDS